MAQPGDKIKLSTKTEIVEGMLVPSPNKEIVILKLSNGYNVGFPKQEIKKMELVEKNKPPSPTTKKVKLRKKLPIIAILHTGGTIASKVDYQTGGVSASFKAEDFLQLFPEFASTANVRTVHVANLMSEDMRFSHYQKIAAAIEGEIANKVDGIIIGHGTDTLAITAAALNFMFDNLPVPVILVGAQRSTDRGSSDAGINLLCAAEFITKTDFVGVAICMHGSSSDNYCNIYPASKTKKLHTSRRDAFQAVNDSVIATVDYNSKKITFNKPYSKRSEVTGQMHLKDNFEEKVAVVRVYPNMMPTLIESLTKEQYKGLVLEATGIGQAPANIEENLLNYQALQKFISQGGTIVLTSQCIFGRVHPDIYANCRRLKEIGIIFGEDMLTETAHVKLAWLLGNYPLEKVQQLLPLNLKGEISEVLNFEERILKN